MGDLRPAYEGRWTGSDAAQNDTDRSCVASLFGSVVQWLLIVSLSILIRATQKVVAYLRAKR